MKKNNFIITIFILLIFYIYVSYYNLLPNSMVSISNDVINIRTIPGIKINEISETSTGSIEKSVIEVKLFDKILLKSINISKFENLSVVPIGKIVGMKLYTNGVLIVGFSELEDLNKNRKRAYENSDIKEGDIIVEINKLAIEDIKSLKKAIDESNGNSIDLTLLREGNVITTSIKPIETAKKQYQLGLWVKDAATGVGTITFYEPTTNTFAALGHGITDPDTNKLINIDYGELVNAKILTVKPGQKGEPGELRGTIINQNTIGAVYKNTDFGIFGSLNDLTSFNINVLNAIDVANRNEIYEGKATILCTADDTNIPKEYEIEIEKIYYENNDNNKSMLIKITDKSLIDITGGIIPGMSGTPIIQNGKFVGAITNVLLNDPTQGYAIFADMMIRN